MGRLALVGFLLAAALTAVVTASPGGTNRGLHVVGNRLVDTQGRTVVLRGVNRSGTEYACIENGGWGIFDGPSDAASVRAIASWHVNFVRVPLNEDCWLGINGASGRFGGTAYRQAVVRYVNLLHRNGIYVELSLIWAAPGRNKATYQAGSPDASHAPAMWKSLARTFHGDPDVILAPWGETVVDARCFLHGGVCEATYGKANTPYRTAGMQQAVTVMRRAGYRGPIAIPGLDYANDLSRWLSHEPRDPLHQLVAEAHVYGNNTCASLACLDRTMAPVARRVPLVLAEMGETYDHSSCGSTNIARILGWAEAHAVSGYAAWTWDTWGTCDALVSDYDGTPANDYGRYVQSFYGSHAATTYGDR
jgi:endoglucanase